MNFLTGFITGVIVSMLGMWVKMAIDMYEMNKKSKEVGL